MSSFQINTFTKYMQKEKNTIKETFEKVWSSIISFIPVKYLILALLSILALWYFLFSSKGTNSKTETYTITKQNIEEAVSLTGRVKASSEATITFEKSGTVRNVNVKTGDKVYKGQVLSSISDDAAYARVAEARAALDAQIAILNELNSKPKDEQIELKNIAIDKIKTDIEQNWKNSEDSLRNIAIGTNDVVKNKFSGIFDGAYATGYRLKTPSCDSLTENLANSGRAKAEDAVRNIENISNNFVYTNDKKTEIEKIKTELNIISTFLNDLGNFYKSTCLLSDPTLDLIRSTITSAQSIISGYKTEINSKINLDNNLKISLRSANEDLNLLNSGEKSEKIRSQNAQIAGARARLSAANAEAAKNTLEAPFSGIITAVDIKVGEFASIGSNKNISLISDNAFEIEVKVSEIDVAKLSKGQKAIVTFDAYGETEKFAATITNISPAGVITDGVPTYKTIFSFDTKDERVKSGMTSNIKVVTKTIENVLSMPLKYMKTENAEKKVTVKNGDKTEDKVVVLGARGIDGNVEVKEGLSEGDIVVLENK
jgi:HlyD family secretion protein